VYCHLSFEYSDYRANYPTHGMLTRSKIFAVKTGQPRFFLKIWEFEKRNLYLTKFQKKITKVLYKAFLNLILTV